MQHMSYIGDGVVATMEKKSSAWANAPTKVLLM